MSARFTETEKWRDPWFQALPHGSKLLFMYLCDRCNTAGFYEENKAEACFHLGIKEGQYDGALEALGRGIKKADGWLWVKNFLRHQKHSELNPLNAVHRGIIRNIRDQIMRFSGVEEFRVFLAPIEGLLSLSGNSNSKGNKEEVQEKPRFRKPEKTELSEEMRSKGMRNPEEQAQAFLDYYNSNGWRIGKAPMKCWKSAVSTWLRNQNGSHRQTTPNNSRVAGTANEGMSAQYAGVGRVKGTSPDNGASPR